MNIHKKSRLIPKKRLGNDGKFKTKIKTELIFMNPP